MQAVSDLIGRHCRGGTVELVAPDGRRWRLGSGNRWPQCGFAIRR